MCRNGCCCCCCPRAGSPRAALLLKTAADPPLRESLLPLAAAGAALAAHHWHGAHDAQRHYMRHNRVLFYVHRLCYSVLLAAVVFNAHFLVRCLAARMAPRAAR